MTAAATPRYRRAVPSMQILSARVNAQHLPFFPPPYAPHVSIRLQRKSRRFCVHSRPSRSGRGNSWEATPRPAQWSCVAKMGSRFPTFTLLCHTSDTAGQNTDRQARRWNMGQNNTRDEERFDADTMIVPPVGAPPAAAPDARSRQRAPGVANATSQFAAPSATHRRATTARPVRPEDKAVVARTTELLRALELVEPPPTPLAPMREESAPVTVIPTEGKLPAVLPLARAPRRTAPRSVHLSLALWLVGCAVLISVLYLA